MHKLIDLTGQKFARLTVIQKLERASNGDTYWLCTCDCGNPEPKRVAGGHLRKGKIRSCGCLIREQKGKWKDLFTKEFLEEEYVRKGRTVSEIAQEYGTQTSHLYKYLVKAGIEHRNPRRVDKVGYLRISNYHELIKQAKERGIEFDLSPQYLNDLYIKQDMKCAITGLDIILDYSNSSKQFKEKTASLDRIDSTKGYIVNNVQWVHKKVNIMKSDMDLEELVAWAYLIFSYNNIDISNAVDFIQNKCFTVRKQNGVSLLPQQSS